MTASPPTSRRRTTLFAVLGLVALAAVGAVVWFLSGDAPGSVDIDQAASAIADDSATGDDETDVTEGDDGADTAVASEGLDGTWTVDTTIGEFSVLDTTGTFVGFRIDEELSTIGETEAVGRTPGVEGELVIEDGTMTAATFSADMTQIVSDESRRNTRIYNALDAGAFPAATFTLTEPVEVGDLAEGEVVEVEAVGTLEVKGVTNEVVAPLQATLQDGVAVVTGAFEITFADYDVAVPTAPIVLSVSDVGDVEFQLYLRRA